MGRGFGVVLGGDLGAVLGVVLAVDFGAVFGWVFVALPHCQKQRGGAESGAGPAGRLVVFSLDFFSDL